VITTYNFLCVRDDDHVVTGDLGVFGSEDEARAHAERLAIRHTTCARIEVWVGPVLVFTVSRPA
jgi:hypothetical protein